MFVNTPNTFNLFKNTKFCNVQKIFSKDYKNDNLWLEFLWSNLRKIQTNVLSPSDPHIDLQRQP